jgi:uncharacterized repeat protein (TIGR03803 family)
MAPQLVSLLGISFLTFTALVPQGQAERAPLGRNNPQNSDSLSFREITTVRQASEASGALVAGRDGNLYGITKDGGLYGGGTVFRITPNGRRTVLKNFRKGVSDTPNIGGTNPEGPLAVGNDGAIYGATADGGIFGYGVLFRIDEAGTYEVCYDFPDASSFSKSSLLVTREGDLYGLDFGGEYARGSIFRFSLNGDFSTVFSFNPEPVSGEEGDVQDPYYPFSITQAANGKIFGTTLFGGPLLPAYTTAGAFEVLSSGIHNISRGTVFRLDGDNEITVLANNTSTFSGLKNLVERSGSNFYGLYRSGIFSVGETGGISQSFPLSDPNSLIRASDTNFYSLSPTSGFTINAQGSVESSFSVSSIPTPPTGSELCRITPDGTLQDVFQRTSSEVMQGLVQGADGALYGTLQAPNLRVFKIQVPGLPAPNTAPIARTDLIYIADVRPLTNTSLVSYESKIDVLGNDSDFNNDALTITAVTQPTWGTATIDEATGKVIYTTQLPKADSFTYTISDGKGGTATGRVSIRPFVNPVYTPTVVWNSEGQYITNAVGSSAQAPFVPISEITLTPRGRVAGQAISKDPATGKIITYRFSGKLDSFGRFSTLVEKNGSSLQIVLKAIPEGHGWKVLAKVSGAANWEGYCLPEDFASIQ